VKVPIGRKEKGMNLEPSEQQGQGTLSLLSASQALIAELVNCSGPWIRD